MLGSSLVVMMIGGGLAPPSEEPPVDAAPTTTGQTLTGSSGLGSGPQAGALSQTVRWAVLACSVLAGAALVTLVWGFNLLGVMAVAALVYSVAIYTTARVVEGSRHATDRLVTAVVTTMFLLALTPLLSVIWTIVSKGVNRRLQEAPEFSLLVITHYERILTQIRPDFMHILIDGRIVQSGGMELASKLEHEGFAPWLEPVS